MPEILIMSLFLVYNARNGWGIRHVDHWLVNIAPLWSEVRQWYVLLFTMNVKVGTGTAARSGTPRLTASPTQVFLITGGTGTAASSGTPRLTASTTPW